MSIPNERTRVCLCCASTEWGRRFEVPETMFGLPGTFEYRECARCGTLQLGDIPEDLGRYYPEGYFSFSARRQERPATELGRRIGRMVLAGDGLMHSILVRSRSPSWADWFAGLDMRPDEPVLDVGSGTGSLLLHLARYGFENLEGVDPFVREDIDYPNGVKIRKRALEAVAGRYRVILFNHSLEHSPEPLALLQRARERLAPRGRLVIRIPLLGGSFRRHGAAFVGLEEAPRHVFVPSVRGLVTLAERAGFLLVRVVQDGNAHHVLVSEQRAKDGLSPRGARSPASRLGRWRAGVRARLQNRAGTGDTATFLFRATPAGGTESPMPAPGTESDGSADRSSGAIQDRRNQ